ARVLSPPHASYFPNLLCLLAPGNAVDSGSSTTYSLVGAMGVLFLSERLRPRNCRSGDDSSHGSLLVFGYRGAILPTLAGRASMDAGIAQEANSRGSFFYCRRMDSQGDSFCSVSRLLRLYLQRIRYSS